MPHATACLHPEVSLTILRDHGIGVYAVCRLCALRVPFTCPHSEIIGNQRHSLLNGNGAIMACSQCGDSWPAGQAPAIPAVAPL